jgi:D-glycero-D-manno-heptose 1,7-bisphosphate phosphatase
VFLDRDGTMIVDVGYLDALNRVEFYPWTVDAIRALNRAGLAVVVVTNQSGVARGLFTEAFVEGTHRDIEAHLAAGGARVDAY